MPKSWLNAWRMALVVFACSFFWADMLEAYCFYDVVSTWAVDGLFEREAEQNRIRASS